MAKEERAGKDRAQTIMSAYELKRLDMPFYSIHTTVYLLETQRSVFVIDSGVLSGRAMLEAALAPALEKKKRLFLLLTHDHWDHTGLTQWMKARGAAVFAHRAAAYPLGADMEHLCQSGYEMFMADFPVEKGKLDSVRKLAAPPCPADGYLEEGSFLTDGDVSLSVLYTPGHCASSASYYEAESGALFSGDAVQCTGYFGAGIQITDAAAYGTSLEKVGSLPVRAIYGGHETAVGRAAVCAYLERSAEMDSRMMRAVVEAYREGDRGAMHMGDLAAEVGRRVGTPYNRQLFGTTAAYLRKYLFGA